jgi:hypothetical protein
MTLSERCRALPGEVWAGHALFCVFGGWLALCVAAGPSLFPAMFLGFAGLLVVYPLLLAFTAILAFQLVREPAQLCRVPPLMLLVGCLGTTILAPDGLTVDIHLLIRVYQVGGPQTLLDWAEYLRQEHQGEKCSREIEGQQLPAGIREYLGGWASVEGNEQGKGRVRLELGGGFYHYGLLVYPPGKGPAAEFWQPLLGWPPELVPYEEN